MLSERAKARGIHHVARPGYRFMLIFVPKDHTENETRVPLVPEAVKKLADRGATLHVEAGMGLPCGFSDDEYREAGATVVDNRGKALGDADMVLYLNHPHASEFGNINKRAIVVSHLNPFNDFEIADAVVDSGLTGIAMELIPRTTLAQKMDALSSQANLAGYVAVIQASNELDMVLPMMMTPAGTLKPARVFVIGVGVAGLQAIATAKRLGARVDAFDTRPVVEEQVKSLGARFVKVDLGETGETKDGYAKALTEEQQAKQRDAMAKVIAQSDVVITTAQVFGRKAPVIVTEEMVKSMRPGAIVESRDLDENTVLDLDAAGNVRAITFEHARERMDIHQLSIEGIAA